MADPLAGFTPGFAALLRAAGLDLGVSRGYQQQASSPGWGTFTAADLQRQRSDAAASQVAPASVAASPIEQGLVGKFGQDYSAEQLANQRETVQKLYSQYVQQAQEEKAAGRGDPGHHIPWYDRVLSVISRPGQAVEGLIYGGGGRTDLDTSAPGSADVETGIGGRLHAAKEGFLGHEHFSTAAQLRNLGVKNRLVDIAGGLTGDVVLDPLTYVGVGIGKQAVAAPEKVLTTAAEAGKVTGNAAQADRLTKALGADVAMDTSVLPRRQLGKLTRGAQPEIDVIANQVGRQAAQTARSALMTDLVKVGMTQASANKKAIAWLSPTFAAKATPKQLAEQTSWFAKIMGDPHTLKSAINTTTEEVARAASEKTSTQLTALLHANLQQAVQRSVRITVGGVPVLKAPIPRAAQQVLGQAAKVDMVGRTIDAFDKVFHTGTRFDNALTVTKARAAGLAQRRIEVGRQAITTAFTGVDTGARRAYMDALATGPRGASAAGIMTNAAKQDVDIEAQNLLHDMGAYIDFQGDGSKLLGIDDINRYLPGRKGPTTKGNYYKFDKRTIVDSAGKKVKVTDFNDLIKANGEYLRHVDPAKFLYALHVATEKALARDQLGRAVAEFGIPMNSTVLLRSPATGRMVKNAPSGAARDLMTKHGYEKIHTGGHEQEVSGFFSKHIGDMIFDPETKKGILRVIQIADHEEKRAEATRFFDAIQNTLKKVLTLPSPAFHIRNSFGDFMTGTADGVFGPRGLQSYEQAGKTLIGLRRVNKPGMPLNDALLEGVDPATGAMPNPLDALQALVGAKAPGAGKRVMKAPRNWPDAPGGYLTDAQLWAAYNHAGLNQGFVLGDLGREESVHNGPRATQAIFTVMDKLMSVSSMRENYFRLAHFIDRLKRSKAPTLAKAAEDAAHYVRKYHFDYTDVTPIEQSLFARALPFYKWQRFATPLMLQLFFAKPGVIANWNKVGVDMAVAGGYNVDANMLPSADQVLPEYFLDSAMLPLYQNGRGNTVYFNMGLPQSGIGTQTLGLGGDSPGSVAKNAFVNLMSSTTPLVSTPYEIATGHRVFGGGSIPTGSTPQYLAGRFGPAASLVQNAGKQDSDTRLVSMLSGLGLSENTPGRQSAYLNDLLAQIRASRRKAGITNEKPTSSRHKFGGR